MSETTILRAKDKKVWLAVIENNDMALITTALDVLAQKGNSHQYNRARELQQMIYDAGRLY